MSLDLSSILAGIIAGLPPDQAMNATDQARAKRSAATGAHRERKTAYKAQVLAACDGDRESIKIIHLWVARTKKAQLFAKGYEKKFVGPNPQEISGGDDEQHDQKGKRTVASVNAQEAIYEIDETVYDLTPVEVPRAKPPKEEIANAQFEGRYKGDDTKRHGGASFFAPPQVVKTHRRPTDYYAPLGDLNWCEDPNHYWNAVPLSERQAIHKRNSAPGRKPIKKVSDQA